ncbi:MAG: YhbY family RNA-binding protein [Candidatus Cloacimonetes bacterium]|nr:YhbY family RNA-binding protein [Candidatus Cloacimonadota bacterium]
MELTNKQRSKLKAIAQNMDVVVKVGNKGITQNVINSLQEALEARELIKISIAHQDREVRKETALQLAEASDSTLVNMIGKTALLFKINWKSPIISKEI